VAISFLSLGSNLGDRLDHLSKAITALANQPKIKVLKVSSVYQTKPVGGPEQDDYLNAVAKIQTELSALELLDVTQTIENNEGRIREVRWGPRTLDIDVLTYDDLISADEKLTLPHPRISERAFVLVPFFEIDPQATISGLGKIADLYNQIAKFDVQLNSDMKLPEVN
jgi:2-amino-4-hydroxy-6-hydroxymethyldihydropteridine diphosphokinase